MVSQNSIRDVTALLQQANAQVFSDDKERRTVLLGGDLVGIRLYTKGVTVAGTEGFDTDEGYISPADKCGLQTGDVLIGVNGKELNSTQELIALIAQNNGETIRLEVLRSNNRFFANLTPVKSKTSGIYKCGLWLRDSVGGIGTLTYVDIANKTVGALGHGITDADANMILPVQKGSMTTAFIGSVKMGSPGTPGQIMGILQEEEVASLSANTENGVFGYFDAVNLENMEQIEVAYADEVKKGKAQICCTVKNGEKQLYDIEIEKIQTSEDASGKNMIIKITDPELIAVTGGIVQGMSGSPIIQNGRLIGAVTHVFINDPKHGFGVFAQEMLKESDKIAQELQNTA